MIVLVSMLRVFIAVSLVGPAPADLSACAADDLRCTGRANAEAARLAGSNDERVRRLYVAHRAYLGLANKGPQSQRERDLCRAQELIDAARKLPATAIHARVVDSGVQTQVKIAGARVDCRKVMKGKRREGGLVARGSAKKTEEVVGGAEVVGAGEARASKPAQASEERVAARGTPDSGKSSEEVADPGPSLPADRERASDEAASRVVEVTSPQQATKFAAPDGTVASPGRQLLIGGGATLAVGMVLSGVAAYTGARALRARKEGWELSDMGGTSPVLVQDQALRREYERLGSTALLTAAAGVGAITAAIVMLTVGARRRGQAAEHKPILTPVAGGLLFTAKF